MKLENFDHLWKLLMFCLGKEKMRFKGIRKLKSWKDESLSLSQC